METKQYIWRSAKGWDLVPAKDSAVNVVAAFGSRQCLVESDACTLIRDTFPEATILGCSTAGEIGGTAVYDDAVVVTTVKFERTTTQLAVRKVNSPAESIEVGKQLATELLNDSLRHVLVLSDGLHVNGSGLVAGFSQVLPQSVALTGGLAGDGASFQETYVIANGEMAPKQVVALGLYGDAIRVGYGSLGGWDPFGPERVVTRSSGNVLYELDGQSALELYKSYLGDHAAGLPSTGLLFPLSLKTKENSSPVVRTILAVDETHHSITFAGDLPEGGVVRFMKANFERLIDGATDAAQTAKLALDSKESSLAFLISCVGRKLVLKQRVEEEVEAAQQMLGAGAILTGFYSYGEIAPFVHGASCELHNQTMTITAFRED